MKRKTALFIAIILVLSISFIVKDVYAEEEQPNKFVKFWRTLFRYPVKVVEESSDIVTDAVKATSETATGTADTAVHVVTGDVEKAPEMIATPVEETAQTIYETAVRTVEMPVEAAREAAEPSP